MGEDLPDDRRAFDNGNDLHCPAAARIEQRIDLVHLPNEPRPRSAHLQRAPSVSCGVGKSNTRVEFLYSLCFQYVIFPCRVSSRWFCRRGLQWLKRPAIPFLLRSIGPFQDSPALDAGGAVGVLDVSELSVLWGRMRPRTGFREAACLESMG